MRTASIRHGFRLLSSVFLPTSPRLSIKLRGLAPAASLSSAVVSPAAASRPPFPAFFSAFEFNRHIGNVRVGWSGLTRTDRVVVGAR